MKKFKALKLFTLLFATFALAACNGGGNNPTTSTPGGSTTSQTSGDSQNPDGTVNVYLVVTEGKMDGQAGQNFEDLFIENAFKYTAKPGTDLPGADKVTSNSGATFLGWMRYEGQGAPTQYTKVPEANNVILYADFQIGTGGQGGGGEGGGGGDTPIPEGATTFTWTETWVWDDGVAVIAWVWGGSHGNGEFVDTTKVSDNSLSVVLGDGTGCCFGRFPAGTTAATADWANKYNQSKDADMTNHTVAWN